MNSIDLKPFCANGTNAIFGQPSGNDDLSFVEVGRNRNDIATPEDVSNGNYELQVLLGLSESAPTLLCSCRRLHILYQL